MPIQPRTVRDAQTATKDWVESAGVSANKWADGYAHPKRDPFKAAIASAALWQTNVSAPSALVNFKAGLGKVNEDQVLATVNGRGKTNYTGGIRDKQGNYLAFAEKFIPQLSTILTGLNQTNPRGDFNANKARLEKYLDELHAKKGQFRIR